MDRLIRSPDQFVALDAEFVGVGHAGLENALARVSLVSWEGKVVYDSHVAVEQPIVDYRTWCSGIRPGDLVDAPPFHVVQAAVARIFCGRVLVGHALHNDLQVLQIAHPHELIRDTQAFPPLQHLTASSVPSLRNIARCLFDDRGFQMEEHSSVEDALMTMRIYLCYSEDWETWLGSPFAGLWSEVFPPVLAPQSRRGAKSKGSRRGNKRQEVMPFTPPASPMREDTSAYVIEPVCTVASWPPTPPQTPQPAPRHLPADLETPSPSEGKQKHWKARRRRKPKASSPSSMEASP